MGDPERLKAANAALTEKENASSRLDKACKAYNVKELKEAIAQAEGLVPTNTAKKILQETESVNAQLEAAVKGTDVQKLKEMIGKATGKTDQERLKAANAALTEKENASSRLDEACKAYIVSELKAAIAQAEGLVPTNAAMKILQETELVNAQL